MTIPPDFIRHMAGTPGWHEATYCSVLETGEQVQSIRLNPRKWTDPQALSFPVEAAIPWTQTGYYLPERPKYTLDPLLHAGAYYVQEASSMFLEQAVKQLLPERSGIRVLDLCAAPGGKSTHLLSLLPDDAVLVSNEVIKSRVTILEENLVKWGNSNQLITNNDPRDFTELGGLFDLIVVDAPCSGSGLFRRDPRAMAEWSESAVELCSQRQKRILTDIWPCLKEGGLLIYSTCSYSLQEDEAIADLLLSQVEAESEPLQVDPAWNIVETKSAQKAAHGFRFYPDQVRGEGFFLTAFRKREAAGAVSGRKGRTKLEKVSKQQVEDISAWLKPGLSQFYMIQENMVGMPDEVDTLLAELGSLYVRRAGVTLGKWANRKLIPDHALALSNEVQEAVNRIELSAIQALQYLRKEEIHVQGSTPGWNLACYKGLALGWLKVLPNRSNNYYPKEWRILMQSGK